ncbi:HD domain-containing protein [Hymenobacter jejuensis]|uniref:Metal-dependent phosphohydrolase n=1 Tax=Hymenobacter jejuensis TaxID=2502781 RepID=A0A5B7ZZR8_9BACT|nr:hypothetical protein [Hymenobacter jejuensis]QDA60651.1 hypothetical protein FHG12_11300 [Hymenobacter jejuensis]
MIATTTTLPARWSRLTTPLVSDVAVRQAMLRQLTEAYDSSSRHYHTFTHIRNVLDDLERHAAQLQDPVVVQLAVWFHDALYNPMRDDNEARSASMAQEFLAHTNLAAARRERVSYLIERTKDHTAPQPAADTDLHLLLDADLGILGVSEADYWQYARQVRQEYRLVPDFMYRRGRRKVLEKLLAAPIIYHTADFRNKLEVPARRNLKAELRAWEQGGI